MHECENLDEVRRNIDGIDDGIVRLLAERGAYVRQAASFKANAEEVRAPKRVEAIVSKVRSLAVENGAQPDIVERVYREMISAFVEQEAEEHARRSREA